MQSATMTSNCCTLFKTLFTRTSQCIQSICKVAFNAIATRPRQRPRFNIKTKRLNYMKSAVMDFNLNTKPVFASNKCEKNVLCRRMYAIQYLSYTLFIVYRTFIIWTFNTLFKHQQQQFLTKNSLKFCFEFEWHTRLNCFFIEIFTFTTVYRT